MFIHHRHDPPEKLNCPHAVGTYTPPPQWSKSFRHILLLPSPSVVYHGRKPTNLRVSVGASAPQLQTQRLRIRSHAGACPPPAQRTATGGWPTRAWFWLGWGCPLAQQNATAHARRRTEVSQARSIATFDRGCRAFLAKAVLRFQH